MSTLSLIFCLCMAGILATTALAKDEASLVRLQREVERLAKSVDGTLGVCAIHIETGRRISLHGGERFPMASTFKIPLALQLLSRVDKGEEKLDRMIELHASDLHPGSGAISDLLKQPGVSLSLRNLLELTLILSDNSATDIVMRESGGPEAVTAHLKELHIEGIRVDRPTIFLIQAVSGIKLPAEKDWTPEVFTKAFEVSDKQKPEAQKELIKKFVADPRDTATPDGMADLLARLWRKELLKKESTSLLLEILGRCQTGPGRLKGLLPTGTEVMHKTGTMMTVTQCTTNDVGIVTLPDKAGHIAIAVFVKASEKSAEEQERAIANISRAVHDYFLFHPVG